MEETIDELMEDSPPMFDKEPEDESITYGNEGEALVIHRALNAS